MAQRPENEPKAIDWPAAQRQLRTAPDGDQADDLIDALTDAVFAGAGTAEAAPVLAQAVQRAHSEFSLRSAALALSVTASADDANAVDALVAAYRRAAEHSFLAPSLLEALGLLAPRSPLARAQLTALLLRLHAEDSRYLLMKAAQVIGCLDAVRPEPDLRAKLAEFSAAQDSAVQAEVRQQLALMELADALLVEDKGALQARLSSARAAFARAELSEEHRPDAAMFVRVLDMLLLFPGLSLDRAATVRGLVEVAAALDHSLSSLMPYDWHDYRSDRATARARRILHIADALRRAAQGVGAAEEWTNFAAALEELARLHAQIRAESSAVPDDGRIPAALGSIADAVFATSLGPLLSHVVQARRLARITADRALAHGEDDITQGLRALEQAAAAAA
ncbi:MAG: hypothetical protein HY320_07085, partial [Armatimonadetes bacterium]|nr:hypothetical protein [Armatimonadota bacterium]